MNEQEPLVLTAAEAAVLDELTRREAGASDQRMTRTYRRMLELVRTGDEIDGILAAHLARDFMSVSPIALGLGSVERSRERFDAGTRVADIAATWPSGARDGEPPQETLIELRRLLDDYDATSVRAELPARGMFSTGDRAAAGYVPDHSIGRWRQLSSRATGLAHRVKAGQVPLPPPEDARRVVEELTSTLLAGIGPFLTGLDEIDRFLALTLPTTEDATRVAALLRTPAQEAYFFEHADGRWLGPLRGIPNLLESTPPAVGVGDGYIRLPGWPQGVFLGRLAESAPDQVLEIVSRTRPGDNARVVGSVVRIARALPPDRGCHLADQIARLLAVPLAMDFAVIEAGAYARDLAEAGYGREGAKVLVAAVRAALTSGRDSDWHLEQILGPAVELVAARCDDLAKPLGKLLMDTLRPDRAMRRFSTIWLRRIDRPPRSGPRREWYLANALYRVLLSEPIDSARAHAARLLDGHHLVLARVALAAIAERPELIQTSDTILADPVAWDDVNSTRHEFRRALAALWDVATPEAQDALLAYAELAEEAAQISRGIVEGGQTDAPTPEQVRQAWRSRLLCRVRHAIADEWSDRLGPLGDIEDEPWPEPEAGRVGSVSPVSEADLAAMDPRSVLETIRDFEPPERPGFEDPTLEGLAEAAGHTIAARAVEFRGLGGQIAGLQAPVVTAVLSAIHRGIREAQLEDKVAAFGLAFELAEALRSGRPLADWPHELRRDVAGTITAASHHNLLAEADARLSLEFLEPLLLDVDPSADSERRSAAGGYDVGMLALNGIRAEATTATMGLLGEAIRLDVKPLAEEIRRLLRGRIADDQSLSVRAAVGIHLPWLLANDSDAVEWWLATLFGPEVTAEARDACWHAYLMYARFFRPTAILLASEYERALTDLTARAEDDRGRPSDPDEMLGIHVGMAHLTALPVEGVETWLARFYARAADWVRARVTRWIAEQAANSEATAEVRDRARAFLRDRIATLTATDDAGELKSVGWIGRTSDRPEEVLEEIVLPALERCGGTTEDEPGLADLVSRCAQTRPLASARALELLVRGDQWHSLPHIAGTELQRALEILRVADTETRAVVSRTVDLLGEQGFLQYRDLLPKSEG